MLTKFFGISFLVTMSMSTVMAMQQSHDVVALEKILFLFPPKEELLQFLDNQFDGNIFPGKFGYQDEAFVALINQFAGKYVNQEEIAVFLQKMAPYYIKTLRSSIAPGSAHAVALKQDQLLKFFFKKMLSARRDIDSYAYFQKVVNILIAWRACL